MFTSEIQTFARFNLQQLFSRYEVAENRKIQICAEWPKIDLEHLTVKNILYKPCILSAYPEAQIFVPFALQPAVFKMQRCWNSEISEVYRMTSDRL